jgi:hypothetical protein
MLAYRYTPNDDGGARITFYDPMNGVQPIEIGISLRNGLLGVEEAPQPVAQPPIRAIRYLDIKPEPTPVRPGWLARTLLIWRLRRWLGRHRRPNVTPADETGELHDVT